MARSIITAGAERPRRNRPSTYRLPRATRAMLVGLAPGHKGAVVAVKGGPALSQLLFDPEEIRRHAAQAVAAHGRPALELVVWENL